MPLELYIGATWYCPKPEIPTPKKLLLGDETVGTPEFAQLFPKITTFLAGGGV